MPKQLQATHSQDLTGIDVVASREYRTTVGFEFDQEGILQAERPDEIKRFLQKMGEIANTGDLFYPAQCDNCYRNKKPCMEATQRSDDRRCVYCVHQGFECVFTHGDAKISVRHLLGPPPSQAVLSPNAVAAHSSGQPSRDVLNSPSRSAGPSIVDSFVEAILSDPANLAGLTKAISESEPFQDAIIRYLETDEAFAELRAESLFPNTAVGRQYLTLENKVRELEGLQTGLDHTVNGLTAIVNRLKGEKTEALLADGADDAEDETAANVPGEV